MIFTALEWMTMWGTAGLLDTQLDTTKLDEVLDRIEDIEEVCPGLTTFRCRISGLPWGH